MIYERYIEQLADELDKAERIRLSEGNIEGSLVIQISDELAKDISIKLREVFEYMCRR